MIKCLNVVRYGMVIKLSQIIILVYDLSTDLHPLSLAAKRTKTNPMSPRHRLKNPFTMSKRGACASYCRTCPANCCLHLWKGDGGAYRDRTDDLMLAKQPLSQLS